MKRDPILLTVPHMSRYLDFMRRVSKTKPVRWTMSRVQAPLDMRFKGTRFAISTLGAPDVPLCYLTAVGRKTGQPRTVPLTFMPLDGSYAVVASNYGRDNHPAWSYNLDATPEAILEIDGSVIDVTARRATEGEAEAIWADFEAFWPGYEEYQAIAPRDIRVYVLDPGSGA